jgi:hypothetical protein
MTFRFTFRVDPEGMTVPYAPITDDIRRNLGFVDLRGHPDRAKEIAEGKESPALRNLLVRVASVGSGIFTLGCDLGTHQEPTNVPMRPAKLQAGTSSLQAFITTVLSRSHMLLSRMQSERM